MRTQEEIIARAKAVREEDFFGFQLEDLFEFVSFEAAKASGFLKADATPEGWPDPTPEPTRENVLTRLRDYLPFAWEKAIGHRGLSAGRSIQHMQAWLWLLEDDDLLTFISANENYGPHGTPSLLAIHKKYGEGIELPAKGAEMAANGECLPNCQMGCHA